MQYLPEALAPLASYRQFILYKLVQRDNSNKKDKLPVNYKTMQVMEKSDDWQNNPDTWTDAETAINIAKLCGSDYGVGFFFTANDPFFFLDIDNCLLPSNEWSPIANTLLSLLPGAAVEISQSNTGLHIFGIGTCPEHACKNISLGLELYTESRFVALTGTNAIGNASTDCTVNLSTLVNTYFKPAENISPLNWTNAPVPEWSGPTDDQTLIKKALSSKSAASAFGGKAAFKDLWNKNIKVLSDAYSPDSNDAGEFDESSADAALAQHLAFWTGKNCERMLNLMQYSQLNRDKWKREDYLQRTILKAVSLQSDVYCDGRIPTDPSNPYDLKIEPELLSGYQFLGASQQIEHFAGCVYVQESHTVFTPGGWQLKPDQFNAMYGGYVFQLDNEASGKVTRKAWEAFTESQIVRFPKVQKTCFKPAIETGAFIEHEGIFMVNVYKDVLTKRVKGDVTPFLNHLSKLLPNKQDQEILLSYMAACIQHKGIKFQWCPLIQGIEGNGKTLFTRCVAYAIGDKYTHLPRADEIGEKFNDWLFNMLFIGIEDIYFPEHKREIIEILKPMITNDRYPKRSMQRSQVTDDVCANFIMNSNHKDAVRKTLRDRRTSIFFTAQQNPGDLERDGMAGDYFPLLYKWLKEQDGYAIVAEYLDSYQIKDELNPAKLCHRAPMTSTTLEAVAASLGAIEQEIVEAIEEDRPGFAGGWISSMALDKLLDNMRRPIARNKRREILQSLGYDWHPGLKDGRVNNLIAYDQGKPRLFIKSGHIYANLQNPSEIARHYQEAQSTAAANVVANHFIKN